MRGIAVLGILFMNIHFMTALPLAAYVNPDYDGMATAADKLVFTIEYLFVNTKFIGLFSMMFGIGLAIQGGNLDARGLDSRHWLNRRLFWLGAIGILHGILLWPGDILLTYAVCGLLLQSQRTMPDAKRLVRRGIMMIMVAIGLMTLYWLISLGVSLFPDGRAEMMTQFRPTPEVLAEDKALWTGGDYRAHVAAQIEQWAFQVALIPLFLFWWCGGMMLIGMGLYKLGWFEQPGIRFRPCFFGFFGVLSAFIGIAIYWITDFNAPSAGNMPFVWLSGVLLAPLYLNILITIAHKVGQFGLWLQRTGRMAFTLYLSQSAGMVLLFRWIRPDLYGAYNEVDLLKLVFIFLVAQVIFANLWLLLFRQGPMEYLWRLLSFRGITRASQA